MKTHRFGTLVVLLVIVVGCGRAPQPASLGETPNIAGLWQHEFVTNAIAVADRLYSFGAMGAMREAAQLLDETVTLPLDEGRITLVASDGIPAYIEIQNSSTYFRAAYSDSPTLLPQAWWWTGDTRENIRRVSGSTKSGSINVGASISVCFFATFCVEVSGGTQVGQWSITVGKYEVQYQNRVCRYPTEDDDLEEGGTLVCRWQTMDSFIVYDIEAYDVTF